MLDGFRIRGMILRVGLGRGGPIQQIRVDLGQERDRPVGFLYRWWVSLERSAGHLKFEHFLVERYLILQKLQFQLSAT